MRYHKCMIAAIVAMAHGRVIGVDNDLPWDLPDDRKYFRDITRGHAVIMGRRTAESIVARLGHGLPNRTNVLVTRDEHYELEGFVIAHDLAGATSQAGDDAFIIGGAEIYSQALPYCDRLYVTEVDAAVHGDTYFPEIKPEEWERVSATTHPADERHAYPFTFVVYDRRLPS